MKYLIYLGVYLGVDLSLGAFRQRAETSHEETPNEDRPVPRVPLLGEQRGSCRGVIKEGAVV
jgi:hypothetical protein